MAPDDLASAGRIRKARSFVEFAAALQSKLSDSLDKENIDLLLADTSHHVQLIHNAAPSGLTGPLPPKLAKDVERHGRDLWNLCVRLKRERDTSDSMDKAKLLLKARSLAFSMLELGRSAGRAKEDTGAEVAYLMSLSLTLGKHCVEDSDLDSARLALQKTAELIERLKAAPLDASDVREQSERTKLDAEYLAMRTALSWKEDRLDVAEHMFGKIDAIRPTLDPRSAEIIADTLQHIGFDLASKGDHSMAVKWLKRAYDIINHQALDQLSSKGLELRLAICQGLVWGLLDIGSPECVQEANSLIEYIESEIGDKPIVLHWRLELLQKAPGEIFDIDAYSSILHRMVRSFDYSDASFYFLLHHIKSLREKNHRLARGLLDELLLQHIISSKNSEWIGKTVVRRVWMSTVDETNSIEALVDLQKLLDKVSDALSEPLECDIAGAAHSVIWSKLDSILFNENYEAAEAWCSIALHRIFMSSGEANLGKFSRKRVICALRSNDTEKARQILHSMSENSKNHILTRYLAFKVSLIDWDHELGSESIRHLSRLSDSPQGRDVLYACIREAQQAGDKLCTLTALQAITESWTTDQETPSNLTSILRCSIRLIHLIEEKGSENEAGPQSIAYAEDLCHIFEKAAEQANQHPKDGEGNTVFTIPELHWFRKNAYNMGVAKCDTWELLHIIRIFTTCLAFSTCYPKDLPSSEATDIAMMDLRCHFVIAAALVSLARKEDRVEEQLQYYLQVRHHMDKFYAILETDTDEIMDESTAADLNAKLSTLFVFDFEAAVVLRDWDGLNEIVRKAKPCRDEVMYKAMGDCVLRSKAPGKALFSAMRLIINEIFELEEFDYEKLAKYIRCMFQAILGLDDTAALQLVDQAIQIAREGKETGNQLPSAELEWLVATSFNHAIDYYARGEEEPCHRWALKAMHLAEYIDDGGLLRDTLQEKFAKLQFDGGPR
ncbi:meiosis protein SPO22/ZIP4 like domain-containing protein [Trichoderma breve]|uniref:Meiosis protein SPO22/ZIP4 like domain-containing protein n=1 Tax=Trichoderma breve TaxID=2034170 RepID=A0A9W9E7Q2_9HYPO|nr:meiosis protein SPO22/ZIP4 like domain-containing protein [Trichoderma breve]KAJ4857691.1 meiosis protein SPO22/ZIP4 like domain-containing protein [Trichoderma breve]